MKVQKDSLKQVAAGNGIRAAAPDLIDFQQFLIKTSNIF
jgi:hypothetical protein